jgi:hypothetical protein
MGEHNMEGVRFFAPREEEKIPDIPADVTPEVPVARRRPAPRPAKTAPRKK